MYIVIGKKKKTTIAFILAFKLQLLRSTAAVVFSERMFFHNMALLGFPYTLFHVITFTGTSRPRVRFPLRSVSATHTPRRAHFPPPEAPFTMAFPRVLCQES